MLKAATETEAESAIMRATQLYPSIREVKLFDAYRYYYHELMNTEVLNASPEMAKNYIRISKGRANRIGHNWEAWVEWFIDKFTIGAEFRTQNHRQNGKGARTRTEKDIQDAGRADRNDKGSQLSCLISFIFSRSFLSLSRRSVYSSIALAPEACSF